MCIYTLYGKRVPKHLEDVDIYAGPLDGYWHRPVPFFLLTKDAASYATAMNLSVDGAPR